MLGLMQDWPLLCHRIIDHAAIYHAERLAVAISQRSSAGGDTVTGAPPAICTASSDTMSVAPQAPGPLRSGSGVTRAMVSSARRQGDGTISAASTFASAGRSRGTGTGSGGVSAAAALHSNSVPAMMMCRLTRSCRRANAAFAGRIRLT